jgi:hypothetical protein
MSFVVAVQTCGNDVPNYPAAVTASLEMLCSALCKGRLVHALPTIKAATILKFECSLTSSLK